MTQIKQIYTDGKVNYCTQMTQIFLLKNNYNESV